MHQFNACRTQFLCRIDKRLCGVVIDSLVIRLLLQDFSEDICRILHQDSLIVSLDSQLNLVESIYNGLQCIEKAGSEKFCFLSAFSVPSAPCFISSMTSGHALARVSPDGGDDFDVLELELPQLARIVSKANAEAALKKVVN